MNKPLFSFIALSAMLTAGSAVADVRWLEKNHDFGAFDENMGTVYCDFRLVNEGSEPIAIMSARANCGCTRPDYSHDPVAPGDTAVIRVGFDPSGRPGRFNKRIYVDCNTEPSRTTLSIQGTVIGRGNTLRSRYPFNVGESGVKLRSTNIPYGKVYRGATSGQYIECYNATSDTIRPRVEDVPSYINVMIQPAAVPPGEQFIISTVLHTGPKTPDWGIATGRFTFYPDASSTDGQEIETVAIVSEDFSKLTDAERAQAPLLDTDVTSIDLGSVRRTDKPSRHQFTITNKGKSPLLLRRVSCSDPAVTVKVKDTKIKPGKKARVEVDVDPAAVKSSELLNARINIIANDPDHPNTTVRVVGEMK